MANSTRETMRVVLKTLGMEHMASLYTAVTPAETTQNFIESHERSDIRREAERSWRAVKAQREIIASHPHDEGNNTRGEVIRQERRRARQLTATL